LEAAEALGEPTKLMSAYWVISRKFMKLGEPVGQRLMVEKLRRLYEEKRATLAEQDRIKFKLCLIQYQADQASYEGRHDEATRLGETLLELAHKRGDRKGIALIHNMVGEFNRLAGRVDAAAIHYNEAHQLWVEVGNEMDASISIINLALIRATQGRYDVALDHWTAALETVTRNNEAMATRLRPAVLGVWAANGHWDRWHAHIDGAIQTIVSGDSGLDMLDAFADSCLLSWRSNAPAKVFDLSRAIKDALADFSTPKLTENIQQKLSAMDGPTGPVDHVD